MNKNKGWVSAYRSLLDDPQYEDPDVLALWMRLLLKANHKSDVVKLKNGGRITIKRGQLLTGRKSLAKASGVNESKVQRILKRWQSEHQIEQQTFNKFRLISITNYDKYQTSEHQNDAKVNTNNKIINTTDMSDFKKPTKGEIANYILGKELSIAEAQKESDRFYDHYESIGWVIGKAKTPMKNWKSAVNNWLKNKAKYEKSNRNESGKDNDDTSWIDGLSQTDSTIN